MTEDEVSLRKYKTFQMSNRALFINKNAPLKILTNKNSILSWQKKMMKELIVKDNPKSWSEIGVLLEDPHLLILRDLVKFPDNKLKGYIRLLNLADLNDGQGSAILPLKDEKVLLLRHYRHATRQWHWEIPRGFGTPYMSAEENARKEISEEIGGEINELIDLGEYHNNTGIEGFSVKLFFALISKTSHVQIEEGIDRFELFSLARVEKMIRDGEITDGFTIAAYTRAKFNGLLEFTKVENDWIISEDHLFPEVLHIQPPVFHDNRGYFMETFDRIMFQKKRIPSQFVLDHESNSRQGSLRGLHYQLKYPQGKMVRVSHGHIYTVAVDMRRYSATFGKWMHADISSENKKMLWIPPGFAHGFYVLSKKASVIYKTTDIYAPEWEQIIAWNDPILNIKWPLVEGKSPILSDKDANGHQFSKSKYFTSEDQIM